MKVLMELTTIEFKIFTRTFMNLFFALLFPAIMMLAFGSIYGKYGSTDLSIPAYICMEIAMIGLMSLPIAISTYREKKILKRFKASPMNPADILISQVLVNTAMTILGSILLVVTGVLLYDVNFQGNIFEFMAAFLISLVSLFSIGFLLASITPDVKSATAVCNIIYFPMIFLSGATMPLDMMPQIIVLISKILPLTYCVNLLSGIWSGGRLFDYQLELLVLTCMFIASVVISLIRFRWE